MKRYIQQIAEGHAHRLQPRRAIIPSIDCAIVISLTHLLTCSELGVCTDEVLQVGVPMDLLDQVEAYERHIAEHSSPHARRPQAQLDRLIACLIAKTRRCPAG